jgi:hypothetical protein
MKLRCQLPKPDAGPNDEERAQPPVPNRASLARSSSSVSFALDMNALRSHFLLMLWLLLAFAGCARQPSLNASARPVAHFTLFPGDTIEVNYSALGPDGPPLLVTVDAQGAVHLPMGVGNVPVQGLSLDEAAAAITTVYVPRFFRSGQVKASRVQPAASGNSRRVERSTGS